MIAESEEITLENLEDIKRDIQTYDQHTKKLIKFIKNRRFSDLPNKLKQDEIFTDEFKNILKSTFKKAKSQLNSYTKYSNTEKYIYLIIEYDDAIFFRNELNVQTRELFNTMNLMDVNLVIHDEE